MIWIPEFIYQRLPLFYGISGFVFLTMPPEAVIKLVGLLLVIWSVYIKMRRIKV